LGLAGDATDSEVVRAVLGGEVERYAVLVHRYRDRYARYAARMLGSLDAGEDAVQDALVRAFDRLADCREPDKFAGWLFLILRNRCYAERRRRQREGRPLDERDGGVAAAEPREASHRRRRAALLARIGGITAGSISSARRRGARRPRSRADSGKLCAGCLAGDLNGAGANT